MISEGSCDTEDRSNDAENSALNHGNKLYTVYINDIINYYYFVHNWMAFTDIFVFIYLFKGKKNVFTIQLIPDI